MCSRVKGLELPPIPLSTTPLQRLGSYAVPCQSKGTVPTPSTLVVLVVTGLVIGKGLTKSLHQRKPC